MDPLLLRRHLCTLTSPKSFFYKTKNSKITLFMLMMMCLILLMMVQVYLWFFLNFDRLAGIPMSCKSQVSPYSTAELRTISYKVVWDNIPFLAISNSQFKPETVCKFFPFSFTRMIENIIEQNCRQIAGYSISFIGMSNQKSVLSVIAHKSPHLEFQLLSDTIFHRYKELLTIIFRMNLDYADLIQEFANLFRVTNSFLFFKRLPENASFHIFSSRILAIVPMSTGNISQRIYFSLLKLDIVFVGNNGNKRSSVMYQQKRAIGQKTLRGYEVIPAVLVGVHMLFGHRIADKFADVISKSRFPSQPLQHLLVHSKIFNSLSHMSYLHNVFFIGY